MASNEDGSGLFFWAGKSLRRQLALIAAVLILVTSALFLVVVSRQYKTSILKAHEEASMNVNMLLQAALENAMIKRDLNGLQEIVARLGQQENVTGVMIANPLGEIRFSSYSERLFQSVDDDNFDRAATTGVKHASFLVLTDGREVLRSINPVHNQPRCGECHGTVADHPINGLLIVDYDASGVRATVRRGALMLAALGVAVLLLLQAGLWGAVNRLVVGRLNRLSVTATAIASGDLTVRTNTRGNDEVARLGARFDEMADRLHSSITELQAAYTSLQTLIDAIPDGVRVISPDFRIVMANKAYCTQIGEPPDQVIGQHCYASSHKRDAPCIPTLVTCPVEAILQGGQGDLTCSHDHLDKNGSEFSVEVSAAAVTLRKDGKDQGCVVESIRDLDTDVAISQKQRLAEMGSLAAGVAHEVHNPLSSISLVLRAIKSQENLSDDAENYLQVAETEIGNCQKITESLLRLTALPQTEPELVDIAAVTRDTASLLSFEAEQAGVTITLDLTDAPRVVARDSDIRNLMFNLAINAIHAMPDGGDLRIACGVAGDMVRIEVEDTGVGIPERDQPKILLPFWTRRADGSRGRGLGLAICSSVVKNLDGMLQFHSEVGVGTRFVIELPNTVGSAE